MEIRITVCLPLQLILSVMASCVGAAYHGPSGYLIFNTGVTLQLLPNKTVRGTRHKTAQDDTSPYVVRLYRAGNTQAIYIYGIETKKFVCVTKRNKAVGKRRRSRRCLFKVVELKDRCSSLSYAMGNRTMYFGLNRSGRFKPGRKGSSRTKFLWRPANFKEIDSLRKSPDWLSLLYTNLRYP